MKKVSWILMLLAAGTLLASYAVPLHYKDGGSMCDINSTFNCDTVNNSPWSELFGIPVAVLGLLTMLGLFLVVLKRRTVTKALDFTKKDFWQYLLIAVLLMLAFQLYLTWVEIFMIGAYCIVCLANQAIILTLTILIWMKWKEA